MKRWVALLRAVNVGGTGRIEMARLRAAAEAAGFEDVATYIASGNLVVRGPADERAVRRQLVEAIEGEFGWCPDLLLRDAGEMRAVLARNPFPVAEGNKVLVLFLDGDTDPGEARHVADEKIIAGKREIFVHFPSGMGCSKLVIPAMKMGTGRNLNTVAKLAAMASA